MYGAAFRWAFNGAKAARAPVSHTRPSHHTGDTRPFNKLSADSKCIPILKINIVPKVRSFRECYRPVLE